MIICDLCKDEIKGQAIEVAIKGERGSSSIVKLHENCHKFLRDTAQDVELAESLEKVAGYLDGFSGDKNIAFAICGISQAIEHLTGKNKEKSENNGFHTFTIAPTRIGMSVFAQLAEIEKNPNCYILWGLEYAISRITDSSLSEEQKNITIGEIKKIIQNL
ncbi:MAG: hypothetical protein ACYCUW_01790 [bacterium]